MIYTSMYTLAAIFVENIVKNIILEDFKNIDLFLKKFMT